MEPHFVRVGNLMIDPSQITACELVLPDEDDTEATTELYLYFGDIKNVWIVEGDAALLLWARLDNYAIPIEAKQDCECDRLLIAGIEP